MFAPKLLSLVSSRTTIILTQLFSGVVVTALAFTTQTTTTAELPWVASLVVMLFVLKQIFVSARELHSKINSDLANNHRQSQAVVLMGQVSARTLAPLFTFFVIKTYGLKIPLLLDAATFFIAAIVSFRLFKHPATKDSSLTLSTKTFFTNNRIRLLTILRSVGFWLPAGIFNFAVFGAIKETFDQSPVYVTFIYATTGLGGLLASIYLAKQKRFFESLRTDIYLTMGALCLLGFSRLGFVYASNFYCALVLIFIGGLALGTNAVASQAIRRYFVKQTDFAGIVGIESIIGKSTDLLVGLTVFYLTFSELIDFNTALILSSIIFFIAAASHLKLLKYVDA